MPGGVPAAGGKSVNVPGWKRCKTRELGHCRIGGVTSKQVGEEDANRSTNRIGDPSIQKGEYKKNQTIRDFKKYGSEEIEKRSSNIKLRYQGGKKPAIIMHREKGLLRTAEA